MLRDRLTQVDDAQCRGIGHRDVQQRLAGCLHDGLRRWKVGLANLHVDDVVPLGLQFACAAKDLHHLERGDREGSLGEVKAVR